MAPFGPRTALVTRLLLAVPGCYAASAGLVAALAIALPVIGMSRSEAVTLSSMLGFAVFLALMLWAFAARRLRALVIALIPFWSGFVLVWLVGPS